MKIVLDTNILISGFLFPGGPPQKILEACLRGEYRNATSPDLLTELKRILKEKFDPGEKKIERILKLISNGSELVYPIERLNIIKEDEPDNRVLECAVTAKAEIIITGDKVHLQKLKSFSGIQIVSPAVFVQSEGMI